MAASTFVRGMATNAAIESAIKHVTVIGGGLMGSGIAQVSFVLGRAHLQIYQFSFNAVSSRILCI